MTSFLPPCFFLSKTCPPGNITLYLTAVYLLGFVSVFMPMSEPRGRPSWLPSWLYITLCALLWPIAWLWILIRAPVKKALPASDVVWPDDTDNRVLRAAAYLRAAAERGTFDSEAYDFAQALVALDAERPKAATDG